MRLKDLGRGSAWLGTATHASLLHKANYIETINRRQSLMVLCPEEIAHHNRWISTDELLATAKNIKRPSTGNI